jgi:hypothetical protein
MGYEGSNPSLSTKVRSRRAVVAQMVERVLGKDEVTGSIPVNGSISSRFRFDFTGIRQASNG